MIKLFSLICIFMFSFSGLLDGYESGHVIAIHFDVDKNENYVLFGLTKYGKLSTFGGLRDSGETDPKNTAAREAEEEALGMIGNQVSVRNRLKGVKPFRHSGGHYCYILPPKCYGKNLSHRFTEIRFNPNIHLSHSRKEMLDIVAVRVDKLCKKALSGKKLEFRDNDGILRSVRVEGVLIEAVKKGYFNGL